MSDPIKEYKKDGKKYYKFKVYTGINPKTGKPSSTTRSGFITKAQAKKERLKIQQSVSDGSFWNDDTTEEGKTFKEAFDEYFSLKQNELKESTALRYQNNIQYLKPLWATYLDKLTVMDINETIIASTQSVTMRNFRLRLVRSTLDFAFNQGYINRNIAKSIPSFKNHDVIKDEKIKALTQEQLNYLLKVTNSISKKYYTIFTLLAFSGIRVGELCALTWDDFDGKNININKTVSFGVDGLLKITTPKTASSIRKVSLDQHTINVLNTWRYLTSGKGFIFKGTDKNMLSMQSINKYLIYLSNKDPKIPKISAHVFRHTHASLLFSSGVNPKTIQKRLGHKTIEMTMNVYTHLFEEDEADDINLFFEKIKNEG